MFKSLLAKLAAMSLLSKTIAVAAAAVIVVGSVAIGLTTQNPSVDPDDQQSGPQQEQLVDVTPDDGNGDGSGSGDSDGSDDVVVEDDKKKDEAKEEEKPGSVRKYTVKFETGEGSELKKLRVRAGTAISSLDTPYLAEHIFLGWYYDAEHTQPVESDDKVTENLTLYANYLQQQPLETLETVNFASAEDVGTGFAISVVSADTSMTAEEVLAAITADDLTDPDAKDVITVSGSNGNFTVKGNGGFHEGGSYRITLNRDELTFKDQPESAREFNFTVHRDEVMNLTMQSDIKYIPVNEVSNIVNNGAAVATLDLALYQTDGNSVSVSELSTGTFTYSGTLAVGDKVCIYEGAIPTARDKNTPKDQLGDMAYLEITSVGSNNTYTYKSAEAEDVLFMPDVLPMPADADTDSDAATITVENKYLDYSADVYSYMNLDSQTTVDVGDFLVFYRGDLAVAATSENAAELTGYGKVTDIAVNGDTTTITYIEVTWAEVEACMDVYAEESLSGAELLEGVDKDKMESEIEQQAYDSGFAEEAATYLASLALATENFTALSDNMNLEDYKVTLTDGTPVSPETLQLMAENGLSVKIEEKSVKARVSTKPTHLGNIAGTAADEKGLAISLEVTVVFTIGSEDSDGQLEITVTGSFVEEVGVDFGVSADAVWDWAFIIPYISDIKVSANVDTMNYTGVSFNATMITKKNEGDVEDPVGDAMDMANEIKDLLEYMTDNGDNGDEMQDQLVERYSEMLNTESDWIRVVEYNIVEVKKSVPFGIPLINISFSVDFVIDMDASISVGFDFQYIEGKRHVFTVSVKDRDVYADTIDLKEKTYQFCFYSMGRIGMKAGIEMDFSISVISASLGSVGFEAGAGAYTNLYGYFFYELKYTESQGKSQKYSGALLVDMGIYLEAGLKAQALGGRYSAEMKFLDKEWPMYEAGRRDNVLDFATEQEDMPELVMKQFVRQVQLPDDAFNMDYLDLMTGEAKNAVYNDWNDPNRAGDFRNGANYSIKITNNKFTYDPVTNTITVEPDEEDLKVEGEMVITWNKKPMAFSSKPIQRTVSLYWDNLRDGYMIVPYTNGGSYVPIIVKNYEAKVTAPADPTKLGYTFDGWYTNSEFTLAYTFPELMPATDTSIYAKWVPKSNIPYTVEHYLEDFRSGSYELTETESFKGTTDTYVTPAVKSYTGYISPAQAELKVEADGSATLRYYYTLERHTVTFDSGKIDGVDVTAEKDVTYNLKYGAQIPVPQMAMKGYTFAGWDAKIADKVGTKNLTYTAMWTKDADTEYRVEYYVQQADGRFTLQHMFKDKTMTGATLAVDTLRGQIVDDAKTADEKYIDTNATFFRDMTVGGNACASAAVDGSGKTVIKINYEREKHSIIFDMNYGDVADTVITDYYDAQVILPADPVRVGYTFMGWSLDGTTAVTPSNVIAKTDVTYTALWKANDDTAYTVKHYQQAVDGSENYILSDTDNLTGTTDTEVTPAVKNYEGFTAPATETKVIAPDGSMLVEYKYTRNQYDVTLNADGGAFGEGEEAPATKTLTFYYGAAVELPQPTRAGYGFTGWLKDGAPYTPTTMPATDLTLTAQWEAGKIGYTVKHYQQTVDGSGYELVSTVNGTADMDSDVTPEVNTYEGFTSPTATSIKITADDTANVVKYKYERNTYTLTWNLGEGANADGQEYTSGTVYFDAPITAPVPVKTGYHYAWDAAPVAKMPVTGEEGLIYTAVWTANSYTVRFNANGGTSGDTVAMTLTYDAAVQPLTANAFTREHYNFMGWATEPNGSVVYADGASVQNLTAMKDGVVDLYAVWEEVVYGITYVLGDGGENHADNPSTFTVSVNQFTLNAPEKAGYTFEGWYTDSQFSESAKVGDAFFISKYEPLTFYAKWEENTYKVVLHANDGTGGAGVEYSGLTYTGDWVTTKPERTGYTFVGWAYNPDGSVVCDSGAKLSAFVSTAHDNKATISLYAKWTVNTYTITYDLGKYAAGENTNPTGYSIETGEDIVLQPLTPKSGYQFGGWYTDAKYTGAKVTTIDFQGATNITLYAKWEHAGTFSVTQTGYNSSTRKVTYTISRSIPDGAVGTSDVQTVYVRTQNGTAYGNTADSTGQDKYHFIHSYAVLSFASGDTSKTFTVTEKDTSLANDPPASWQIGGKARTYRVEIYKIENTADGLVGTVGTKSVTRTMPVATKYQLSKSTYNGTSTKLTFADGSTSKDFGYDVGLRGGITQATAISTLFTPEQRAYASGIGCSYRYQVTVNSTIEGSDNPFIGSLGYLWARIYENGTYADLKLIDGDIPTFTFDERAASGGVQITVEVENGSLDRFKINNITLSARIADAITPAVKSAAPLATTAYAKGDKAYITVIYNEPINYIDTSSADKLPKLTLASSTLGKYFENAKYVNNGTGTNALVFEVTAKKAITAQEIQDVVNRYLTFPVSNVGGTFSSNIGTLSASVKDILGN